MERNQAYTLNPSRGRPSNATEIVDYLINSALRLEASDIHIGLDQGGSSVEPYIVRFRIHGKLQMIRSDFLTPFYREVIARLKVLGGISTTEYQVPLDGQFQVKSPLGNLALRIATIPSQETEEVVIRLQRSNETLPSLGQLGLPPDMVKSIENLTRQKSGMIILNGPAGSGKTTTIYALLGLIASPERKIITAEDPIEMRLRYVSHTQVGTKTDFSVLSRAFMRQDADVIFIGEVRDAESAEAAIQLAQTGHLVLTTLHTRDSIGVISRLETFEIHPNFIANSLIASLSQRLVQKLCRNCKIAFKPKDRILTQLNTLVPVPQNAQFYKAGPGCPNCSGGISGRIPIFELFLADLELSEMINQRRSKHEVLEIARKKGMKILAEDALRNVYEGTIDLGAVYSYVFGPSYSN